MSNRRLFTITACCIGLGSMLAIYILSSALTSRGGAERADQDLAFVPDGPQVQPGSPLPIQRSRAEVGLVPKRAGMSEDTANDLLVVDPASGVAAEQMRWAEDFYRAPEAAIKAIRYRFIQINWDLFYNELEKSPAYLAASSGRTPPPVYDDSAPTFLFDAFENQQHQLLVTDVRFYGESGSRRIVMRGLVIGERDGQFKIATTEGKMNLSGQIETANSLTRLDTLRGATMTSVAEINRQDIERAEVPIDQE